MLFLGCFLLWACSNQASDSPSSKEDAKTTEEQIAAAAEELNTLIENGATPTDSFESYSVTDITWNVYFGTTGILVAGVDDSGEPHVLAVIPLEFGETTEEESESKGTDGYFAPTALSIAGDPATIPDIETALATMGRDFEARVVVLESASEGNRRFGPAGGIPGRILRCTAYVGDTIQTIALATLLAGGGAACGFIAPKLAWWCGAAVVGGFVTAGLEVASFTCRSFLNCTAQYPDSLMGL